VIEKHLQVYYKEVTEEFNSSKLPMKEFIWNYYRLLKKTQFSDIDWAIIDGEWVKKVRIAKPMEYFEKLVFPNLAKTEKEIYENLVKSISSEQKEKLTLEQVMVTIKRKRQEIYEQEQMLKKFTPEELERRKKQAESIRKKLSF